MTIHKPLKISMTMKKLNNITTQYRKFSKGQYIEHTQFNEFLDYFEDQDRLSKTLLRGVGISCGFKYELKYTNSRTSQSLKTVNGVEISQGVGVTTDGDLLTLSNISKVSDELGVSDLKKIDINSKLYSFFKPYDNSKANYAPFYEDDGTQIPLWELSETNDVANNTANGYSAISESSSSILNALYLLIYVECYEKEVRPCRGVDCDNHGLQQVQNVKVLFTNLRGINNIVAKGDTLYPHPLQASPPELRLKRALVGAELNETDDFKSLYSEVVLDLNLLNDISQGISIITSHFKMENHFDILSIAPKLGDALGVNNNGVFGFQYAYDFMKDLIETYTEIKTLLPKSFTNCFPNINAFPKHVMIGKVVDNSANDFRHEFYNSPILDDKEIEAKVKVLIQRFNQLIDTFMVPQPGALEINITPSKKSVQLGSKAIPFYYEFDEEFFKQWSFDKTRHRVADRNLTYNNLSPLLSDDLNIRDAITFNLEKNTFYRIEGHQSQPYYLVANTLNTKKDDHQLSFDVMSLSLEELVDNKDLSKGYYKEYVEKHPGIEHTGGVAPGGTFVLVYESERNPAVIADFSLPYLCCGPKLDVNLSLPQDVICANAKPIPFTVSPLNGTVEASVASDLNGGVTFSNGQYYFNPTLVSESLYDTEIGFTVNGKQTSTSITVIEQPKIGIAATNVENDVIIDDQVSGLFNTTVTFTITSLDGSNIDDYEYEWDFLDNGNFIPQIPKNGIVQHSYGRAIKVIPSLIRVLISGNGCSEIIDVTITEQNNLPEVVEITFVKGDCCENLTPNNPPVVSGISFVSDKNCCDPIPIIEF
jgi:hypothetical protein